MRAGAAAHVCLVSSAHISTNPRVVKEADALYAAGYHVTVVAADVNERLGANDRAVLARRKWRFVTVSRGSWVSYAFKTALQAVARLALRLLPPRSVEIAMLAHDRLSGRLADAAATISSELYIAHNLAALPAAAAAARKWSAKLGFDAEDFHTEELTAAQRNPGDQAAREMIERGLLPICAHRTAASPLIARAYHCKYGVQMTSLLNVSPLVDAPEVPHYLSDISPHSFYWFSQTIGRGRGLEQILSVMAMMSEPSTLYMRGEGAAGYREELLERAQQLSLPADRLQFLTSAPPDEMVRLAQPYSLGLSLELNEPPNRAMCLTNKVFTYLLAGLPVLLSRTPAQVELANELGEAAILIDLNIADETANTLDRFFRDAQRQENARAAAWRLGRIRYNWDVEQRKFLGLISHAMRTVAA